MASSTAMRRRGLYGFESIDDSLAYVPLAARRALDAAGLKLSLAGWLSLPVERRRAIVDAGVDLEGLSAITSTLAEARPPPQPVPPAAEPSATTPPETLRASLGPARPLDDAVWASLGGLDRYALAKTAPRAEKLARAYDEIIGTVRLTHVAANGAAHMVDVASKVPTLRRATASARVHTAPRVARAIATRGSAELPKGDVLAAARIAGLLGLKRTPELIPLCHPVQTTSASIEFDVDPVRGEVAIRAEVAAFDRTGVEMEAMMAASLAALTLYDMIKGADRWARIEAVQLDAKSGGKSGPVHRPAEAPKATGGPGRTETEARTTEVDAGRSPAEAPTAAADDPIQTEAPTEPLVALRDGPLSSDEAMAHVRRPGAGAVALFVGTVRDRNDGRPVVRLEYEAYAPMAVAEMRRIAEELRAEFRGCRIAVLHRVGSLDVGDTAVVCAASAPHRHEAFSACRALLDRIKARVPIWKREHGPDGAYWIGWQDARCDVHDHP